VPNSVLRLRDDLNNTVLYYNYEIKIRGYRIMCEEASPLGLYFNCKVCGQKVSFGTGRQYLTRAGLCRVCFWDEDDDE